MFGPDDAYNEPPGDLGYPGDEETMTYRDLGYLNHFDSTSGEFPGDAYDKWKTTEPEPMPSAGDVCNPVQDAESYAIYVQLRDYRLKYGVQALKTLCDEGFA
jgi:hypothetical protein